MRMIVFLVLALLFASCGNNKIRFNKKRTVHRNHLTEERIPEGTEAIHYEPCNAIPRSSTELAAPEVLTKQSSSSDVSDPPSTYDVQVSPDEHDVSAKSTIEEVNADYYPGPQKRQKGKWIFVTIFGILLILFGAILPVGVFVASIGAYGVGLGIIISVFVGAYFVVTGIFLLKGRRDENKRKVARILLLILGSALLSLFILLFFL